MKFQDPSMHGSNVTEGIKKCDPHTYGQAKSNIPHQLFFQSWGHKICDLRDKNWGIISVSCERLHAFQII